jgi:D-glycero-D-manno-heptose 1,7-bisphosphate phosphatase
MTGDRHPVRAVFFDRDGVVNRSPGEGYVLNSDQFHLNEGIVEALTFLKERGVLAILVTSQKGVGKRLMSQDDLDRIHAFLGETLSASGVGFDAIYAYTGTPDCPHQPKPDPEMIFTAAERFSIDLRQSYLIGDADRDIEMGKAAGLGGTIRVRGEKPILIEADQTIDYITEIADLLKKTL